MCLLYLVFIIVLFFIVYKLIRTPNILSKLSPKKIENFTQNTDTFTDPAHMFFKAISDVKLSDKIILTDVDSKCYLDKNTIDVDLKQKVKEILVNVISHINKIMKKNEYNIDELLGVYIIKDNSGNYRLIINTFIYDVKNYYQAKFIVDVVFMKGKYYLNYMNIDERATNNLLNYYDARNVNNNPIGVLLSYDMVHDDIEDTLNQYYRENNNIIDFSNLMDPNEYNIMEIDGLSKYYLPDGVPNLFSPSFCVKNTNNWDQDGVPFETKNKPDTCIANNNALTKILNEPYDYPGSVFSDGKGNNFGWMFSLFSNPGIGPGNGGPGRIYMN